MKKYISIFILAVLALNSCDFLDKSPDNRTVIDTKKKVQLLLGNAYVMPNYGPIGEMSSDNMIDNNSPDPENTNARQNTLNVLSPMYNQLFAWEDVDTDSSQDSPTYVWTNLYHAIAVTNQALSAIEELEQQGEDMSAEKAEALICRAYSHFILVNIFSQAYKDPESSKQDLGIPYMTKMETEVKPQYDRSTVAHTYQMIQQDLEAALPYINDSYYSVPKYHFNVKAAYAFAARFYLFIRDYDKVIEYADKVLGSTPAEAANVMFDAATCKKTSGAEKQMYAWYDASSQSNLLIQTTYSMAFYVVLYNRYNLNRASFDFSVGQNGGPNWNGYFPGVTLYIAQNQNYGVWISKLYSAFEYTNKVAGIGYPHNLRREFTTGETLLCRAEAKIMKGDINGAVADLNVWTKGYNCKSDLTTQNITSFYRHLSGTNYAATTYNAQLAPTLHNTDMSPSWTISDDKLPYLWCVLHFRRIETMHDGMRFFDLKRYGIEIEHRIDHIGNTPKVVKKLVWNDDRRAIQLPVEVLEAGLTPNPRVILGDNENAGSSNTGHIPDPVQLWLESKGMVWKEAE